MQVQLKTVLLLIFMVTQLQAWNSMGHFIVSGIAQKQLEKENPKVLANVLKVLESLSEFFSETQGSLLEASVMAHYFNTDFEGFLGYYHYRDVPDIYKNESPADFPKQNFPYDIQYAMWATINIIKDSKNKDKQKTAAVKNGLMDSMMLRYLLHIVGDVHQPLHDASFFSQTLANGKYSEGDLGGVKILVHDVLQKNLNDLHSLWDSALGLYDDPSQLPLTQSDREKINLEADRLMTMYPQKIFGDKVNVLSMPKWVKEGHDLAVEMIYSDIDLFPVITPQHIARGQTLARKQLVLAGYRLSKLLQSLYNDPEQE
jgi:hypothetical protein